MVSACKACDEPLVVEIEGGDAESRGDLGNEELHTVPDDLRLGCGCHFHWECLMEHAADVAISLQCPSCQAFLPVNQAGPSTTNPFHSAPPDTAIPASYQSEGGVEDKLDLLPTLTEEAYLTSHPEARPARAFLVMCSAGDLPGIVQLLQDISKQVSGDTVQLGHLIRYRDPLGGGKSALHLAIEGSRHAVLWLLLWLASALTTDAFPASIRATFESMPIGRVDTGGEDIRRLPDEAGEIARDTARAMPGVWDDVLNSGVLDV